MSPGIPPRIAKDIIKENGTAGSIFLSFWTMIDRQSKGAIMIQQFSEKRTKEFPEHRGWGLKIGKSRAVSRHYGIDSSEQLI